MTPEATRTAYGLPVGKSDRSEVIDLLGDGATITPDTYDRFEAWWYGAAVNSRRAFVTDLRCWLGFRHSRHQPAVPAGAIDVRDFIRARVRAGLRSSSIARQLASISILHDLAGFSPSPVRDRVVTGEMKGLRREEAISGRGRPAQALPLRLKGDVADLVDDVARPLSVTALVATLDLSKPAHLRDRVLLLLGTDLGRRRSEYAAMNVGDVAGASDGTGTMLIRRSKTDQSGEGRVKYVSAEAMAAIRAWLTLRQGGETPCDPSAPLLTSVDRFGSIGRRLSDDGIRHVLLGIARRGLAVLQPTLDADEIEEQCRGLSGHSFRVGLAQDLTAAGEGLAAICQAADWSSPAMPTRYAEALAARSGAVARLRRRLAAERPH